MLTIENFHYFHTISILNGVKLVKIPCYDSFLLKFLLASSTNYKNYVQYVCYYRYYRYVAEQLPTIGLYLRNGFDSYLEGNWYVYLHGLIMYNILLHACKSLSLYHVGNLESGFTIYFS